MKSLLVVLIVFSFAKFGFAKDSNKEARRPAATATWMEIYTVPTKISGNGYGEIWVDKSRGIVCYMADRAGMAISCLLDPLVRPDIRK